MELLYLIDRMLTRLIQLFSRWVESRLKVSAWFQGLIGMLVFQLVHGSLDSRSDGLNLISAIPVYASILIATLSTGALMALTLGKLHRFFDPEGYFSPDKEYLDGNRAWGYVVVGAIFLFAGTSMVEGKLEWMLILGGGYSFFPNAYEYFVTRKRGSGKKSRATVTERLRKLLEACKNWLPQPKATPA